MALHRDIFRVGRQWAVTGAGIQAVDQRLRGVLDIEIKRLWDDDLVRSRRAKPGVNAADFDQALTLARERFPQAPVPDPFVAQLEALGVIEVPIVTRVVPAIKLHGGARRARSLPQWRVRR